MVPFSGLRLATVACLCLLAGVSGARPRPGSLLLPEHARGGQFAELMDAEAGLKSGATTGSNKDNNNNTTRARTLFLNVPLDHFASGAETSTFPLQYFVDDACLNHTSGPIFVRMGGEGAASPSDCDDKDNKFGALHVSVEHRFYGKSVPNNDMTTANLKYLTVEQNLADTAAVVSHLQEKYPRLDGLSRRAVGSFGGSYSGATSAVRCV